MITVRNINYKGQKRIGLFFKYDLQLIALVKKLPGRRYSASLKCWHLPKTKESMYALEQTNIPFQLIQPQSGSLDRHGKDSSKQVAKEKSNYEERTIPQHWLDKIEEFKIYLSERRYSTSSINSYVICVELFLAWASAKKIEAINIASIRKYNYEYFIEQKRSRSYQNVWINALKLFISKHTEIDIDVSEIERPRKSEYLPDVLSKEEVKRFISSFDNLKHRTIVTFYYACGLRKAELIHLKLQDIDIDRLVIRIRNSKGAKDRDVALPKMLHTLLDEYISVYHPKIYVFNGQNNIQYSASSIDKIIKKGLLKAGIKKKISAHNLRHSYATHLVEHQVNLRFIQEALGHKSSKTTEIYTKLSSEHIGNMVSPIDYWDEDITSHSMKK